MSRPIRIEYPGAVYHITARGNRRDVIFLGDEDRLQFLEILGKTVSRYNWICHTFCLMNNHYHLLVETPDANLSQGMRQLNGVYTQYFNRNHDSVGHLFQGRFKSILVEKESYLLELCRYIVCNPVKAGICKHPGEWRWSSFLSTVQQKSDYDFLTVDWILKQFSRNKQDAKNKYHDFVEEGLVATTSPWQHLRGQVLLGSPRFVEEMREYVEENINIKEIPRAQRIAGRPVLAQLFQVAESESKDSRNSIIVTAHLRYCYTMKEIADYLGIHYSTVSRVISKSEGK